jgi:hypothetical protein
VALALLSAAALAAPPAGTARTPEANALVHKHRFAAGKSLNWAGYIKTGTGLTSSSASWQVPTLKTDHDGYSSTWVGIDGAASNDQYLIQTGTEADVVHGRAQYHAWWEVITPTDPAPETLFLLAVHPGDSIRATVTKGTTGRWTMSLRNATTGHAASHATFFAGPGKSAEWIQEDTDVNGYISAAPNWQSVTFAHVTLNGTGPKLSSTQATDIVDSKGVKETATSTPNATKDGFSVRWLAAGSRTYVG